MSDSKPRWAVRYGDDGRIWHETDSFAEAYDHAKVLADDKGKAQILDRQTGERQTIRAAWWA